MHNLSWHRNPSPRAAARTRLHSANAVGVFGVRWAGRAHQSERPLQGVHGSEDHPRKEGA